jgi:hypothetical protein
MKLIGWLFEEQEQTEQQRKLGVINDLVYDILGSHTFFPEIKRGHDERTWILKTGFNGRHDVNVYLTYSYEWTNQINVFQSGRNGHERKYKNFSSMKIKPELNTEDSSFQEFITGYFSELLAMFESMFELQRELPKRYQEVVEFLGQQPNKFNLVYYSPQYNPTKSIEFTIINNPKVHHTALIEIKLSVSEGDSRTRIRFYFMEEDGEELLGTIMLRREETFEQGFLKDWPWIESRIENMFVGDRD